MQVFARNGHKNTCILGQWCRHIGDRQDNCPHWQIPVSLSLGGGLCTYMP